MPFSLAARSTLMITADTSAPVTDYENKMFL